MTIDDAIIRMMSCSPGMNCPREEACFLVVTRFKELIAQSRIAEIPEPEPDVVAHYAPTWEATDWSAA